MKGDCLEKHNTVVNESELMRIRAQRPTLGTYKIRTWTMEKVSSIPVGDCLKVIGSVSRILEYINLHMSQAVKY